MISAIWIAEQLRAISASLTTVAAAVEAVDMSVWTEYDPKAPPSRGWYVLAVKGKDVAFLGAMDSFGRWTFGGMFQRFEFSGRVTHYMPLPITPEAMAQKAACSAELDAYADQPRIWRNDRTDGELRQAILDGEASDADGEGEG